MLKNIIHRLGRISIQGILESKALEQILEAQRAPVRLRGKGD
jgi:hypothetical protein